MTLNYQITFLSDWHCGSGLSGGAEADATVIKNNRNLPYIPGKTIKGLIREALTEMKEVNAAISGSHIDAILGREIFDPRNRTKIISTETGVAFFSNVELPQAERDEISIDLSNFLYRNLASTQIEKEKGTAKLNSLRVVEVCIPFMVEGQITGITNDEQFDMLEKALKWVRHLGVNRNRGFGRCRIAVTSKTK